MALYRGVPPTGRPEDTEAPPDPLVNRLGGNPHRQLHGSGLEAGTTARLKGVRKGSQAPDPF